MPTAATNRGPPLFQLLIATKKFLQDTTIDARYVWSREISRVRGLKLVFSGSRPLSTWLRSDEQSNTGIATDACCIQLDVLEQDVSEILHLIRSWRNRLAPVNRIPPEILALIPDFWDNDVYDEDDKGRSIIALTHVCQAWREVYTSRSSLWTDLDCEDEDQAHIYLERSKSLPVNLSLYTDDRLPSYHPFFKIIPHAIGRLGSLTIDVKRKHLQDITAHLSHPAPLLEKLSICGGSDYDSQHDPVLTFALFNGDLSSLRKLRLTRVRIELPRRNMVNLTSFKLSYMLRGEVTVRQLLDFFENTPRLRKVSLYAVTPAPGAQDERLVPLVCLEAMKIYGGGPASLFLDHLLIPAGARLIMEVYLPSLLIKDHPPRFLDNLRNLPNFTTVDLCGPGNLTPYLQFSGPNGQVEMIMNNPQVDGIHSVLESLNQFDTSRVERLTIRSENSPSSDLSCRVLLPMKHLRTLILYQFSNPHVFIYALHPDMSPSGVVVCPGLEELIIGLNEITVDMESVIGVVAARASKGVKIKSITIAGCKSARADVLELKKHVSRVEYSPQFDNDRDGAGEGD